MNRIFLSSTWSDLRPHREAIIFALNKLQQKVSAMEYFGARKGTPLSECLRSVRTSDVFVLVVGMRYGAKDDDQVSITQREYEQAYSDSKIILVYIVNEDEHPVLPKNVDFGDDAARLASFKDMLLERHVCDLFVSPDDLAVKVVVDLFHNLDLTDSEKEKIEEALEQELPDFVAAGGYSVGLSRERLNLSKLLRRTEEGIAIDNHRLNDLLFSGYIAQNLVEGNFNVLRGTLAFDGEVWKLIEFLCTHWKINNKALSAAIARTGDALQFRVLVSLAGGLSCDECAEAICNHYVHHPHFEKQMIEFGAAPYTIKDAVKYALSRMSNNIEAVILKYISVAKRRKHWQAKKTLEYALREISNKT